MKSINVSQFRANRISLKENEWFTSPEAAFYLGISKKSLLNKVSAGQIPYFKFGRLNRYRKSDLEGLLASQRRGPQWP